MRLSRTFACLLCAALPALAAAHDAEKVVTLRDQPLAEPPGYRGLMLTVSFKPGQVSAPHVHPGPVFVYVLEGTVQTQLEGGPVETYTVGQKLVRTGQRGARAGAQPRPDEAGQAAGLGTAQGRRAGPEAPVARRPLRRRTPEEMPT